MTQDIEREAETMHNEAMQYVERAIMAQDQHINDETNISKLYQKAFEKEKQAASKLKDKVGAEPSRSVLYRSAAALAIDCNQYGEALTLIKEAVQGSPEPPVASELRDLLERVQNDEESKDITVDDDLVQEINNIT